MENTTNVSISINCKKIKKIWLYSELNTIQPLKKNGILSFAATWMEMEIIILTEVRQA
jgi:hypothetical protein